MRLADTVAAALLARLPHDVGAAVFRRGAHTLVGVDPDDVVVGNGPEALVKLDSLASRPLGLWVGWCAFELGHALERVVARSASLETPAVPDAAFARFGVLAGVGPDGTVAVRGEGRGRPLLQRAAPPSSRRAARATAESAGPRAVSGAPVSTATTSRRGW